MLALLRFCFCVSLSHVLLLSLSLSLFLIPFERWCTSSLLSFFLVFRLPVRASSSRRRQQEPNKEKRQQQPVKGYTVLKLRFFRLSLFSYPRLCSYIIICVLLSFANTATTTATLILLLLILLQLRPLDAR